MSAPHTRRRGVLDVAASAALLVVPVIGFWPTFGAPTYLLPALGGLGLGAAVATVGARARWGTLIVAAVTVGVYAVFGTALAVPQQGILGVVPTPGSLRALAAGVVTSWKQLLTTVTPVAVADGFGLVPFLLMLTAGVLTTSLALRLRQPAWALLPAAGTLATQIAMGTAHPAAPVVEGVVFAVVSVVWLSLRQAWSVASAAVSLGETGQAGRAGARRRVVTGAGIIAVAVTAGVATSGFVMPASPRYVLRDVVIPPFTVQDYPSPLQSFRTYVRDDRTTTLFTVDGLPAGARVRLAVMDAYSGTVYNVSDTGFGSSSAFSPVRSGMSGQVDGTPATVHIRIGALRGVWMPDVGAARTITFDGPDADALRHAAQYNEATSSGIVTTGLGEGDAYDMRTVIPARPTDRQLAKTPLAPVKIPKQQGVPQDLAAIAGKITADAKTPVQQVRALQKYLADGGFFSHGLAGEVRSLPGHGAARISALLESEQMVGDDEQYAAAMALLAGQLGIPARVVMGFHPAAGHTAAVFRANGDDLHAWVEVPFQGVGWVAFDPTPPKDHIPTQQNTRPRADPKPQVLQPPPPEQQAADTPPTVPTQRGRKDPKKADFGPLIAVLSAGGIGVGVLAVLASPFVAIGALKLRRRKRRRAAERAADRVSGGWDELVDSALDHGVPVPAGRTRREDAAAIDGVLGQAGVAVLARQADAQVWGPADPTDADVDAFWHAVDALVGDMSQGAGRWRRLCVRVNPRSLLAGTRAEKWLPRPRADRRRRATDAPAAPSAAAAPDTAASGHPTEAS